MSALPRVVSFRQISFFPGKCCRRDGGAFRGSERIASWLLTITRSKHGGRRGVRMNSSSLNSCGSKSPRLGRPVSSSVVDVPLGKAFFECSKCIESVEVYRYCGRILIKGHNEYGEHIQVFTDASLQRRRNHQEVLMHSEHVQRIIKEEE